MSQRLPLALCSTKCSEIAVKYMTNIRARLFVAETVGNSNFLSITFYAVSHSKSFFLLLLPGKRLYCTPCLSTNHPTVVGRTKFLSVV